MASQPSGPVFPVHVDMQELAEDLVRASDAGKAAIEPMVQRLEKDGAPAAWLRRCDAEAHDGTRLPGCVKLYIPQPVGRWARCSWAARSMGIPKLFLLAVGERHPSPSWRLSVYEIAHRRLRNLDR
jgi:hypothetical protein